MAGAESFSPDYTTARARFRSAALALGCEIESHTVGGRGPDGEELTVDVARAGDLAPRRSVVVSSGLHGVEGYFGSAVQAALLEEQLGGLHLPAGVGLVVIHALNPFGFAWGRRVDAANIDLNRNFLLDGEAYEGAALGYAALNGLLNPTGPPSMVDLFWPTAAYKVATVGMSALRQAVAGGQYEFPHGLFFGGEGPSVTKNLLAAHLPRWVGGASRVLHVDFHTGLGPSATYKIFVDHAAGSAGLKGIGRRFGASEVEPWSSGHTSYAIRGGLGGWCKSRFGQSYDVLAAEFGTVPALQVIRALRIENQATFGCPPGSPQISRARERLKDVFCPRDPAWRNAVIPMAVKVVVTALEAAMVTDA